MSAQLKRQAKILIGSALEVVFPKAAHDIDSGAHSGNNIKVQNLILQSRILKADKQADDQAISTALQQYWQAETSQNFYTDYAFRYESWFLVHHAYLISLIKDESETTGFNQLLEIGCGDGQVLNYCYEQLPNIAKITGIDIHAPIIEKNINTYSDTKIQFVTGDAQQWLANHLSPGFVLLRSL